MRKIVGYILFLLATGTLLWLISIQPQSEKENLSKKEYPLLGSVVKYNKDKSFNGYTLIPVNGSEKVYLLDMEGRVFHQWDFDADRARLLPNGNILVVHGSKWGLKVQPWKKLRNTVREYNWDGEIVWEYKNSDIAHHDIHRLKNGDSIYPVRQMVPNDAKTSIKDPDQRKIQIRSDNIVQVSKSGELVWEWKAHEHLDLNDCGRKECTVPKGKQPLEMRERDWTHINTSSVIPENKWFTKLNDSRFKPGNVVILPRNWWTVLIVDRQSNNIVWRYTGSYKGGLSGGHEAHIIPEGLPGAGNMLIFDNGRNREKSIVLEINPATKEIVWKYEAENFFSRSAGSAQRLPNGNTFISEDVGSRSFEITEQGEIVWEYQGGARLSRAKRYPIDFCPQFLR